MNHEVAAELINDHATIIPNYNEFDPSFWFKVKEELTDKQWTYVQKRIIEDKPLKLIALEEQTTIDAVRGWGKEVKRKLKPVLTEYIDIE
ncbi:hypothetical protein E3U55_14170 [Filobacillus milosensis]|uniref:Uncharacterized protein n=2 Tax=Filobacillus milosensis TaxID=94137 RepID=A0A4Y8IGN6_9BACI|nr:hypothetical protein E3U55_14170 [Filobacillus milosensis]